MTWVDEVKQRADLLTVAQRLTPLKATGSSWRGPCPIHGGKGPNFAVHPERGTYYCYVCHAKGDVFSLLQALEGLTFLEAAERLANELGVEVVREPLSGGRTPTRGRERADLQRRFVSEGGDWWSGITGELAVRAWGLGARRAGDSVVGTSPIFLPGERQPIGWMCYERNDEGDVAPLGFAPESDPLVLSGFAHASDLGPAVERTGALGVMGSPIEAVLAWEAGGRNVIGLATAPSPATLDNASLVSWLRGMEVESILWGVRVDAPEHVRAFFALEEPTIRSGFASLGASGALAGRTGHDLAIGVGEALGAWEESVGAATPSVIDSFQWRIETLASRARSGSIPLPLLREKLGPSLRAASRLVDRRIFYAYSRWAFRAVGGRDFNRFLGEVTRAG